MTNKVRAFAPAKVNLTLHITGQRADGYHLLDSLVAFADVGDALDFTPAGDLTMNVSGPFATGVPEDARNLVWQAAAAFGWSGHIDLRKNLPNAAGIGGGSSDAAATLKMLKSQGVEVLEDAQLALGADVPVCMEGAASRMRGIGERVERVSLPPLPALLVNPGSVVPTRDVFAGLASKENPPMQAALPKFEDVFACVDWLSQQRNDLENPARQIAPDIETALTDLSRTQDQLLVRMSGSGATCFALYPNLKAAHFAAYEIGAAYPDWWCVATTLS